MNYQNPQKQIYIGTKMKNLFNVTLTRQRVIICQGNIQVYASSEKEAYELAKQHFVSDSYVVKDTKPLFKKISIENLTLKEYRQMQKEWRQNMIRKRQERVEQRMALRKAIQERKNKRRK